MKNLALFLILSLLIACKFESPDKQYTPKPLDASKAIFNWICEPGEKVGLIAKNFTETDIIKVYGKENTARKEIGLGEGETTTATAVFPDTENEIFVCWKLGEAFKKIDEILINNPGAPWNTSQGIGIGTTLDELVQINGKDFQFAGFEWDYSGYTNDWQGGKINKNLTVFLEPENPEAVYPELLGDALFSSNIPQAKEANLKVRTMVIQFD